jgi:hypothetical protein
MFNLPLLAALLATPIALTAQTSQKSINYPFTLFTWYTDLPGLGGNINANGGSFWLRKNTSSFCPDIVKPNCPVGNVTSFIEGNTIGTLALNTAVPGGQQGMQV